MMKPCPSSVCGFSLLMCFHPWITHILTTLFITSSHALPLRVIPGSSHRGGGVFVPVPLQALGTTQQGSIAGWFPQESQLPSPEQVQGKEPLRPLHAASLNHPSRQLPAACVAFVTPPGLPCSFPCHITACV